MCIPPGLSRKKQKKKKKAVKATDTVKLAVTCDLTPPPLEVADEPEPKLIRLEVVDAAPLGGEHYWCVADSVKKVRVKAITEPDTEWAWEQLDWEGGTPIGSGNEVLVDITNVADVVVKASLDVEKSVTIEIYDLTAIACPLPKKVASRYKSYESDKVTRLKATTNPDLQKVWDLLTWSEGTPTAQKHESDVALKPVGDRTVTVSLGGKALGVDLHICQWPRLTIKEVTFECHEVLNDGEKEIDKAFDKKWISGRAGPAKGVETSKSQSPICFTQGKKIKLSAVFTVNPKSTDDETVSVKGNLGFGEVKADITVPAGKDEATMPATASSAALPGKIDCQDAWKIDWTHTLEDGSTWVDAQSSTHLLYVTLADPTVDVYFTLLDISCRAAAGKTTENDLVAESFVPFTKHTDDNNGFERKGDGLKMSYYKTGTATAADDTTYTTRGILSGPEATGRCGGWAELLIHMWGIHGVTSVKQRWYVRALEKARVDMTLRFLVKNCDFSAAGTLPGLYTHKGVKALKLDGAPGQGKKNPQFDFGDHVIVKHGGKLFDPSYGLGPYSTDKEYLSKALDGLGTYANGKTKFTMTDGTKQHIPKECVPYSKGFAEYRIGPGTLGDIAAEYGVTAQRLLDADPILKAKRGTVDKVVAGDAVVIPTTPPETRHVNPTEITFDKIATGHGLTKDVIFDHARNSALKSLRKTHDKVIAGDMVIVSWEMIPDGAWVIGHDM